MKIFNLLELLLANIACWGFITMGSALKVASEIEPFLKDLSWIGGVLVSFLTVIKLVKSKKND